MESFQPGLSFIPVSRAEISTWVEFRVSTRLTELKLFHDSTVNFSPG
jgi:hypothetical protein